MHSIVAATILLFHGQNELDILAMVRTQQTKLRGGYDCGDPCAEPSLLFAIKALNPFET